MQGIFRHAVGEERKERRELPEAEICGGYDHGYAEIRSFHERGTKREDTDPGEVGKLGGKGTFCHIDSFFGERIEKALRRLV